MQKPIETPHAPQPIGPYSQAVLSGNMLFISGQIAINPATGDLTNDSLEAEAHQVMKNLQAILAAANMDFGHVVKTTIFLRDMAMFAAVNAVYGSYLVAGKFPARETVAVLGLPKDVRVEISMIAVKGEI